MKIGLIIKNHQWAIVLAVLVGIIMALPQIYFRYEQSNVYQGIDLILGGEELFYWGRVQEVRDGYLGLGNVFSVQGKGSPYLQPPLGEAITAYLGKIFSLDIRNTILLARFVFPALLFLAIYAFLYLLFQKKYLALIASSGVLLADDLFNFFSRSFFQDLLRGDFSTIPGLGYVRPVHPEVSSLFFFTFLIFFWLFFTKKRWIFGLIAGIILGLSFYVYPYTWTFLFAFLGILGLIFLFKKAWPDIKGIVFLVILALLVAIPYFLNLLQVFQSPEYLEASPRMGLIKIHQPTFSLLPFAILIIFLLFFPRLWEKRYVFCLALLLAPFLVLNQQIITGLALMDRHYHWYYHKPLAIIFLSICFFELMEKKMSSSALKKTMITGIMALLIFNGLMADKMTYNYYVSANSMAELQNYGPVLDWLQNNAKKDEVVLANDTFSTLIQTYTSCNVGYNYEFANRYLVSGDELTEGMFLIYRLGGVSGEQAEELFFKDRGNISAQVFSSYYREKFGDFNRIPDEVISNIIEQYQAFLNIPLKDVLQKYQIKYLVWDKIKETAWSLDQYPFLTKIYEKQGIAIYQII